MIASAAALIVEAAAPIPQPLPGDDRGAALNRAAASEFYAAQEAVLETGDVRRLTAAVAPSFVNHRPGATAGLDRAGLIDDVTALRSVRPGVQLTVEIFLAEGDRVLAYVSLRSSPMSRAEGLSTPMPKVVSADTIEMVRVAGGVER